MSETPTSTETGWGGDDLLYLLGGILSAGGAVLFLFVGLVLVPLFGFAAAFFGYQLHAHEGRTKAGAVVVAAGLLVTLVAVLFPVL